MSNRWYELPPDELLLALGTLLVAFSKLEETLRFVIGRKFGEAESRCLALTTGLTFRVLVDKFGAIYRDLPLRRGATSEDITAFCAHLSKINDDRNRLVHAIWHISDGTVHGGWRRATSKRGLHSNSDLVTATPVRALADRCDEADTKLIEYLLASESPPPHASIT